MNDHSNSSSPRPPRRRRPPARQVEGQEATPPPFDRAPSEGDAPYQVGFGKPPQHTQFQPGQSGNPKGRPKGSRSTLTLVGEVLDSAIVIREGGKQRKGSKLEAMIISLYQQGMQGDARAQNKFFDLALQRDRQLAEEARARAQTENPNEPSAANLAILRAHEQALLRRHGIQTPTDTAKESGDEPTDLPPGDPTP